MRKIAAASRGTWATTPRDYAYTPWDGIERLAEHFFEESLPGSEGAVISLLRTAMADATGTQPEADPDRASLSTALPAARDLVIQAAGVIADTTIDLVGTIGRHVLNHLMPDRRLRVCPRIVKRAISKYQARGPDIDRTSYKATIGIDIFTAADP